MHLIRVLVFLASHFNFWFTTSDIAGDSNTLTDVLSRNNINLCLFQVCQAHQLSSRIPPPLIDLLVCNITWTSTIWIKLFRDTLQLLYSQPLTKHKVAKCRYVAFCESFGITPLSISEGILCYCVACLCQQGLAHSSI